MPLESTRNVLLRLQAHARLMARNLVTQQDAVVAVTLVQASMQSAAGITNALHTSFPVDPDEAAAREEERLLVSIGLVTEQRHGAIGWR